MKSIVTTCIFLATTLSVLTSYGQTDFFELRLNETPLFMDADTLSEANLSASEMSTLKVFTEKCFLKWNLEQPIQNVDQTTNNRMPEDYYCQYLAVYNRSSGEKFVWINFVRKQDVRGIPKKLFASADNPHAFNCWVNLAKGEML